MTARGVWGYGVAEQHSCCLETLRIFISWFVAGGQFVGFPEDRD